VLVAVVALSVQLFADISGYTDLATGVARLFGLRFPASFAAPYTARSLADFWHRWHLTVARWFRDYVYRPLGGDRRGGPRAAVNIAVTFLLAGLWHGANPTFLIWAAIHAAGLVAEGWWRSRRAGQPPLVSGAPGRVLAGVATFAVVSGAWVFFGARDVGAALSVFGHLVVGGAGDPSPVTPLLLVVIAASLAAQFVPPAVPRRILARVTATPPAVQAAVGAAALLVIRLLGPDGVARFVYERF
jgi:D-alanyl-lipoteichoic acid acyltransferase DltB (MBOAT superfamily)